MRRNIFNQEAIEYFDRFLILAIGHYLRSNIIVSRSGHKTKKVEVNLSPLLF
jgi:hypothetical protein